MDPRKISSISFVVAIATLFQTLEGFQRPIFSPGNIRDEVVSYIQRARNEILAAVFVISEKAILRSLIEAHSRGVKVMLIVDETALENAQNKLLWLVSNGIKIFVYPSGGSWWTRGKRRRGLMHHKFAVIDGRHVIVGSFNWTTSASKRNFESVLVTDDPAVARRFRDEFYRVLSSCNRLRYYGRGGKAEEIKRMLGKAIERLKKTFGHRKADQRGVTVETKKRDSQSYRK